jgi:glycine oxidase
MDAERAVAGRTVDVVVVGAGLIALASAWRLRGRGLTVAVVDPAPAAAASRAAAGMLAPVTEAHYGEEQLLRLSMESLRRYPAFVAELESLTGEPAGLRATGTLLVAADAGDRAVLTDLHAFHQRLGLAATMLSSRECRALEPMLAPSVRAGLLVDGDQSVDNRRLAAALLRACDCTGVDVVRRRVAEVVVRDGSVAGVTLDDGTTITAETVVVAAGASSAALPGLPAGACPPVRPVKGQILRLRGPELIGRSVRAVVAGRHVYLVPRTDGELVVGATVEELGDDVTVTAGAVHELLHDARTVVPGVDELALVETTAASRPGSPDNVPMIGRTDVGGLVLATGHYRNGVLLTPVTADLVAAAVTGDGTDEEWAAPVSPRRFGTTAVPR